MLDIGSKKRQGGSGGLSSRPSQISPQIRRDEGTIRRELNRSSSPPSNLRGMSADAAERWSNSANSQKPRPNLRGMSPDAAERWSNAANRRGTYNIKSGDTLSAIAQRELGSSSRWREIKKADGSSFSASEAGRLQVGQQYLPGARSSANKRDRGQTLNLRGMSPDAAEAWSGGRTRSNRSSASSNTQNNVLSGTVKGTAVGAFVASRNSGSSRTSSNFDTSVASRNSGGSKASSNFSIGRMTERAWNEHLDSRPDVIQNIRQTTWKDPRTGRSLKFPGAASRRPDNFLRLNNGRGGTALEIKGTPSAAETTLARRQLERDRSAIRQGARLGNKKVGLYDVRHIETKIGLPVLGAGGNTALPGEIQKHITIQPQSGIAPRTGTLRVARAVGESRAASGALRGVSRIAAPIGVGLDVWQLKNAYQQDRGFGENFRKTAGSVAGGWGGAAGGAAAGAAFGSVVPVVGTTAGAIVGGVVGGIAGSELGDDIEQKAEEVGKGIKDGAKKAWNKLFG